MSQLKNLSGRVIMFDGPDYVGKTTQLQLVKETLAAKGLRVFTTRYNGGSPIGEALRLVMLSDYERPSISDLYINLAQQHALTEILQSERAKGSVLLVDRSPLSIIAYQVYGGGLNITRGYQAADEVMALHKPDVIICYQAPDKILTARRQKKAHETDFFETQPSDYFDRVAKGYQVAIKHYQPKVVSAVGSINDVHAETMTVLAGIS